MRLHPLLLIASIAGAGTTGGAQIVERIPREPPQPEAVGERPRAYVGGAFTFASPRGPFHSYVNAAFGAAGNFVVPFDPDGIVALRGELGFLIYGNVRRRQSLGGGALGLIDVDVNTSNNILFGGLGLQLMAPTTNVRPYLTGNIGFSYFFTTSSVEGSSNVEPFAQSDNFSDAGFTTLWGGGLYIPLRKGPQLLALDLGAQFHKNADMRYLNENSIYIASPTSTPVITPIRSAADFITFRIGVMFAVR